jgi:uncharacterized protein YehS (DUF1456 family)
MINNEILRQITASFELDDAKVMKIFALGDLEVTLAQTSAWLKKSDDGAFTLCEDPEFAAFLNGWIIEKRGRQEGPPRETEQTLSNNQVFSKLKIALNLQAEEVMEVTSLGGLTLNKRQLSAFFRKPGNKHYRECTDQCLQSFLKGMQARYRKTGKAADEQLA